AAACSGPVPAVAQPLPPPDAPALSVPARSAVSVRGPNGLRWGTPNEFETRSALSMAKLYLADYALRHGDGSPADRMQAEGMTRRSEDPAADLLAAKCPQSSGAVVVEYCLAHTPAGAGWNIATSSTADLADLLAAKQATDPTSPILGWMASASPTVAHGTQ